jgi:decaprenylphospho-beta-D-erythro-pentofuranosid-2-ulose 2-reductase
MNVAVLGTTRGMGLALARLLAARGDRLFLLGRDPIALGRTAGDLEARSGQPVAGQARCDLAIPDDFEAALDAAHRTLDPLQAVVVTAGEFDRQAVLERDAVRTRRLLTANFTNTLLFCEIARTRLTDAGGGTLCVFSSVAGDRARASNVLYGAAKAGLSAYLEGLDHRYRRAGLVTICVKPGFVKTGMTAGLAPPPFAADAEAVARRVVRAIDRGEPVVYAPGVWRGIMAVVRQVPRFVMRRAAW